jgi:tetratricopeptide (TPR) repeat protein
MNIQLEPIDYLQKEVAELRRQPAGAAQANASILAGLVNNLATSLSAVGRRAEALAPAQEAVELYRALARQDPDAFQPDLAMSLNNLANRLSEVGHRTEALTPAQEAVELYRALARQNPDAFQPELATSLGMMGKTLERNERREEALACFAEGVRVLTPHFRVLPAAHGPLIASLARDYVRLAQALNQPPDEALLAPVNEVFARPQTEQPPSSGE